MDYRLLKSETTRIVFKERAHKETESTDDAATAIQLMKSGIFSYFSEGDMPITPVMFQDMCTNFEKNARGIDLAVDYGHENSKEAAGWITGLSLSDSKTELIADVKWTPKAAQMIKDGEYRYISAEWSDSYKNEQGVSFGPTLFGAGLTNRPFLKKMTPLSTLSESNNNKDKNMTMEELQKSVTLLEESVKNLQDENKALKLAEEEKEKKISTLEKDQREASEKSKKDGAFNKLLSQGKACEAQRASFLSDDVVKFAELAQDVNLETRGHSHGKKSNKKFSEMNPSEAEDEVMKLAQERMEKNPKNYGDIGMAFSEILYEMPELAKKYQEKFEQ